MVKSQRYKLAAAGLAGLPAEAFEITGAVDKDSAGYLVKDVRALVGDDIFKIHGHIGDDYWFRSCLRRGPRQLIEYRATDAGSPP